MSKQTKEEKVKKIQAEIEAAQEDGAEEAYIAYLMRIKHLTIHNYDGGVIILQSGEPKNPPY